MKQEEINEGNKLIAVFMGLKKHENGKYAGLYEDNHACYPETMLGYNTYWNWLMPVLDKIVSLNPKKGKEWYYYNISHCHGHIWSNTAFGMNWETKHNSDKTLTATWLAVIEFIKWKNDNK